MEYFKSIVNESLIEALGWSIFHSLWQAGTALILLVVVLLFLKDSSARIRYAIAYMTLIGIFTWSIVTGVKAYKYAELKVEVKEQLLSDAGQMKQQMVHILSPDEEIPVKKFSKNKLRWVRFKSAIQKNFDFVILIWLSGIFILFIRMAGGMVYLLKLPHKETLPFSNEWQLKLENLCIQLSINRSVKAVQSYLASVPMVIGQLKPVVILPIRLFTGLSEKEIEAIIAHELAHIKRNDYLFNVLQSLIETLLFYHPAVWFISKIIRDEREHRCDEIAVQATGDKLNYIKALASAQEMSLTNPYKAVAFAQSNGGLLTRVKRLKTLNTMKTKTNEKFLAVGMVFLGLVLLSFTAVDYQSDNFKRMQQFEQALVSNPDASIIKDTVDKKVKQRMAEMEEIPEELEQVVEVALSAEDDVVAAEILKSIEEAMKEIEWAAIQEEALREVEVEMAALNVDSIVSEAMREAQAEMELEIAELKDLEKELHEEAIISEAEALQIAKEAIEVARVTMETIELDSIIEFSVNEAFKAIGDLNIGELINDAMDVAVDSDDEENKKKEEQKMKALEEELDELEK